MSPSPRPAPKGHLPRRRSSKPPRVEKVGLVLLSEDRRRARFAGLSVNQPYAAEDRARCRTERCPVEGEHAPPHVAGTCGFHGTSDDPLGWMLPETALLDVELYGRIIRHERGWRAASQRVLGAQFIRGCMSCYQADPEAVLVTIPAPVVERALLVGPRCRRCAAVWRWPDNGGQIAVPDLAGMLGTEVSWADAATSAEVLRRSIGRRPPGRATA
jgi:hypothetical protein